MPGRFVIGQDSATLCAEMNPDFTGRSEAENMRPARRHATSLAACREP